MSLSAPIDREAPEAELRQKLECYARTRDRLLRAEIAQAYLPMAASLAGRYAQHRESREDLEQAARVALVGAIDRFDPGRGVAFSTFAWATIAGELKHHLRDRSWALRVPRRVQEHSLVTARAADELHQERGRPATVAELCERTGLDEEATIEALEVRSIHQLPSLDAAGHTSDPRGWDAGATDDAFEQADDHDLLRRLLARLSDQERELLRLRFCEQLSQSEMARRIGVSQMHVSRLLASLLARMRSMAAESTTATA
ncbi:MAG: sigma-70 family RNA polymerase sigma factor [Actinobacteria bacterium]|nr:sigma-70 family RNA polymerase sigma factor [Actinomycetota bacterium]